MTSPLPNLTIRPWPDPVVESAGVDARSDYVEKFWLPLLGPSATWLVRRLAEGLEVNAGGYECSPAELAWSLGLGRNGRSRTLLRTLRRGADFGVLRLDGQGELSARRKLAPLSLRQIGRLPASLQEAHRVWQDHARETGAAGTA